ncbi:hypothetical protein TWF703_009075 [Orbilia oligospora]|uniref:DUF6604 domain-containing protein n=1 Tax=Orbilia oligospora TaxID=2813651 RepID=A0A7C8JSM2_ORBOL|nr:hypothetical protein TWF703_009075 [Orbilia oligospora]
MLDQYLKSHYLSYKIDTNSIIDWLAQTGKKHGYPLPIPTDSTAAPKENETNNNKITKGKKKNKKLELPRTYNISVRMWVELAEYISKISDTSFTVPQIFFVILEQIISGRKEAEQAYDGGDSGHAFCIAQLQEVLNILLPRRSQVSSLAEDDAFKDIWKQQLQNSKLKAQFRTEELDSFEDFYLSSYYLILDVINIRRYLKELWSVYNEGAIDLAPVSLATNLAISLVREMEAEFDGQFPGKEDYEIKTRPYYVAKTRLSGVKETEIEQLHDTDITKLYNIHEDVMLNCYQTLEGHIKLFPHKVIVPPTNTLSTGSGRMNLPDREKVREDHILLLNLLNDLPTLLREDLVYPDEIMGAYRSSKSGNKISLWQVLAFQIYIDTYHVLGPNTSRPWIELQGEVDSIGKKFEKHEKFCNLANRQGDIGQTGSLKEVLEITKKPHIATILQRHHLRCGIYKICLRRALQSLGGNVINRSGSVVTMYQLYHALPRAGLLKEQRWEDLDFLLELHGHEIFLDAKVPTNIATSFNSLAEIVPGGITRRHRELTPHSTTPITNFYLDALQNSEKQINPEQINNLIIQLLPSLSPENTTVKKPEPESILLHSTMGVKEVAARWKQWGKISPEDLLANFAIALQLEVRTYFYDYLEVHRICWKIFRDIRTRYSQKPTKPFGAFEDDNLPDIAVFCLYDGIKRESPKHRGLGEPIGLLEDAAKCISNALDTGLGAMVCKGLPADPDPETSKYPTIAL